MSILAAFLVLALGSGAAVEAARALAIGYVELEGDPRYRNQSAYAGIEYRTIGRPWPGAELGIQDAAMIGEVIGTEFTLLRSRGPSTDELAHEIRGWADEPGANFVLADLPAADLIRLADALADAPVLLINVSAPDDRLRGTDCRTNLAHAYPSDSMLTDALAQHLVSRGWRKVLALKGPSDRDRLVTKAMSMSVRKFGGEIVEARSFALERDPRRRGESNVALLTGRAQYDVVFVADESGEFGRYVAYQTSLPRPVVGGAGLVPVAWHWTWHRHGAPQLQHRFERAASPRRMNGTAWAAWAAVKAVTQAALRTSSTEFEELRAFLLSDRMNLDGVKGNPMSFRPWDRQLRQPVLLATGTAVIARAPFPEFLHQKNSLDTLGPDAPESRCSR